MSVYHFHPDAQAEMISAAEFIQQHNVTAAARFIESIEAACELLVERPDIGESYRYG